MPSDVTQDSDPPPDKFAERVGAFVVASAVTLGFLQAFGIIPFEIALLRLFLYGGIALVAGTKLAGRK